MVTSPGWTCDLSQARQRPPLGLLWTSGKRFPGKLWVQLPAVAILWLAQRAGPRERDLENLRSLFLSGGKVAQLLFIRYSAKSSIHAQMFPSFPVNSGFISLLDCLSSEGSFTSSGHWEQPSCLPVCLDHNYSPWHLSRHLYSHLPWNSDPPTYSCRNALSVETCRMVITSQWKHLSY